MVNVRHLAVPVHAPRFSGRDARGPGKNESHATTLLPRPMKNSYPLRDYIHFGGSLLIMLAI
jgi:hypothetical protein